MRFVCKQIGLSIIIDEKLIGDLSRLGFQHYPNEYGGLLVGRYVKNNEEVIIQETVLPIKFKSSEFSFERGTEGMRETLTAFFEKSPSLIYVGEWHTHPNGRPVPSHVDFSALQAIAEHDEVLIKNPLLLIISLTKTSFKLGFHVFFQNKIYAYEKED